MIEEFEQSFPLQETNQSFAKQQTETRAVSALSKQMFTVHLGSDKENNNDQENTSSLQDAFKKFRKNRQKEIRETLLQKQKTLLEKKDPKSMQELRMKFLNQAKKYFGVPYAKRYHPPESSMHNEPLFLDCCGLTRRILRDLKEDFGFNIGPWNQAYQYDTLPISVTEEEMLPGDLVFITGTYFNPKSKAQKHDMVHVEIWLGDGEKTIGARWQKGVVQVFDSYKFVSKSYYNMQYHFKSIDTWLQGVCRSYCPEHEWCLTKFTPGIKSIFSVENEQSDEGASDCEDDGNDENTENLLGHAPHHEPAMHDLPTHTLVTNTQSNNTPIQHQDTKSTQAQKQGVNNTTLLQSSVKNAPTLYQENNKKNVRYQGDVKYKTIDCYEYRELVSQQPLSVSIHRESLQQHYQEGSEGPAPVDGDTEKKSDASSNSKGMNATNVKSSSSSKSASGDSGKANRAQHTDKSKGNSLTVQAPPTSVRGHGPYFFIGGGNGVSLVEEPLLSRGWRRIHDKNSDNYRLRWVELKSQINYTTFKAGDQLVNRIPNGYLLTTKTGLFNSLREYERVLDRVSRPKSPRSIRMNDFFPESFVLDLKADRDAFFETFKGETWICKPNGMNQGKGIYLVRDLSELKEKYSDVQADKPPKRKLRPHANQRLIQRYIPNPLLLNGKKFDVRSYMLIASTTPFIVFFHQGYCRLSCDKYDPDSHDLALHLTNQYQQKKNPSYQDVKEDTVWSMERFNEYVNSLASEKGLSKDWVLNSFTKQMMKIMTHCFHAVKNKLECRYGFFELLGFDFLVDTDFNIYVLEINCNPALHTNCEVLKQQLPPMIEETLDIVIEVFEKTMKHKTINPIHSVRRFIQLYNTDTKRVSSSRPKSLSPTRPRPTPMSPVKKKQAPPAQANQQTPPNKAKERTKSTTSLRT
ncbi:uncharacterized protein [Antedon mediterranea]|uniref:uncharacterized protein isoform X2 n=1 Tax=Antedon mediterranea TaxID=105859 RepID=UPI003AF74D31